MHCTGRLVFTLQVLRKDLEYENESVASPREGLCGMETERKGHAIPFKGLRKASLRLYSLSGVPFFLGVWGFS